MFAMFSSLGAFRPIWRGVSFTTRLTRMQSLAKQRRALDGLTESQLRDIGIAPEDAMREAKRPVWDVPAGWKR